ncbi:MAG TPA: dienelactone hydrolase family protein [Vicinamibacterales bacterium]|jgi:predicted esterase
MTSVLRAGPVPAQARLTTILVHGRGASAADIITLAPEIGVDDVAFVAPDAPDRTWYPYSFLVPMERNEPHLSRSLAILARLVDELEQQGIDRRRLALAGFSQGACLSLEFAARHASRFAAIIAFSGGLIGPPETPRDYPGSFDGTPVFIGCSDVDPHIPVERVRESTLVLRRMGAVVDERIYPGMGHTIAPDEIDAASALLRGATARDPGRRQER